MWDTNIKEHLKYRGGLRGYFRYCILIKEKFGEKLFDSSIWEKHLMILSECDITVYDRNIIETLGIRESFLKILDEALYVLCTLLNREYYLTDALVRVLGQYSCHQQL